jgi:hypothetical protein
LLTTALKTCIIAGLCFFRKVCCRCDISLLSLIESSGNYYNQIDAALLAAGQSTDNNHINNSLFYCINDNNTNGNINFVEFCSKGCQDGGAGNSDHCK